MKNFSKRNQEILETQDEMNTKKEDYFRKHDKRNSIVVRKERTHFIPCLFVLRRSYFGGFFARF